VRRAALLLLVVAGACVASASNPAPQTAAGGSRQRNVVVTHDHYLGHVEPDVAVNPRNPSNLIGACQFELGPRKRLPGTFASFDGGHSWHDNGLLPLPTGFEQGADTTVAFGADGVAYVIALMAHGGGGFPSRVSRGGIFLWRSHDGGRRYAQPVAVYVGRRFQDHPWLGVRRSRRSTTLFVAWTNSAGLELSISHNGGASFARPQVLVRGSAPSDPVLTVGSGSTLHVFFQEFMGQTIRLDVVTSKDDGAHFGAAKTIATIPTAPLAGCVPTCCAVPPPMPGAATDLTSGASAVAIGAQD
jgi:hypothetical protein